MRQLKFRIYDEKQNKFLNFMDFLDEEYQYNGVCCCDGNLGILAFKYGKNGELISKLICDNERFIIMQYTNIQDKSGVEIYEKDYVKILRSTYEVIYDSWSASFKLKNIKTKRLKNFYQNPFTKNLYEISGNKMEINIPIFYKERK